METSQKTKTKKKNPDEDGEEKLRRWKRTEDLGFVWFLCLSTFPSA
jgi:hypothetical protein